MSNDDDEDENDNVKKTTALHMRHPFSTFFDVHWTTSK